MSVWNTFTLYFSVKTRETEQWLKGPLFTVSFRWTSV